MYFGPSHQLSEVGFSAGNSTLALKLERPTHPPPLWQCKATTEKEDSSALNERKILFFTQFFHKKFFFGGPQSFCSGRKNAANRYFTKRCVIFFIFEQHANLPTKQSTNVHAKSNFYKFEMVKNDFLSSESKA